MLHDHIRTSHTIWVFLGEYTHRMPKVEGLISIYYVEGLISIYYVEGLISVCLYEGTVVKISKKT
jgi:hypothetical protein